MTKNFHSYLVIKTYP